MSMLNKQSTTSDVQEVSHTSNLAQLTSKSFNLFNKSNWIIDSGATDHMCHQPSLFVSVRPLLNKMHSVTVPDGRKNRVEFIGDVTLPNALCLKEVLFVPTFHFNLISVQKLTAQLKCNVGFYDNKCIIHEKLKKNLFLGNNIKGLYYLQPAQNRILNNFGSQATVAQDIDSITNDVKMWHLKLGHMPFNKMKLLFLDFKVDSQFLCTICPLAKQPRLAFSKSSIKTNDVFELIHVDICYKNQLYYVHHYS